MKQILKKYFLLLPIFLSPFLILYISGCDDNISYLVVHPNPTHIECTNNEFDIPKEGESRALNTISCPDVESPLNISTVWPLPVYTWRSRDNHSSHSNDRLKASVFAPVVENQPSTLKFYDAAEHYYQTPIILSVSSNFSLNVTITPDLALTGDPDLRYDPFIYLMFAARTNRSMEFLEYFNLDCDSPCSGDETTVPDSEAWAIPPSPIFPIRPWQIRMNGLPEGKEYTAQVRAVGSHIQNEAFAEEDEQTITIPVFQKRSGEFDLLLHCHRQTKLDGTLQLGFRLANKDVDAPLDFSEFTQPRFYLYQGKEMVGFVPDETMFKRTLDNGPIDLTGPVEIDAGDHGIYQVIFAALRNGQPIQLSSYFRTHENIEPDTFSGATCEAPPPVVTEPPVASFMLHDQLEDEPPFNIISVDGSASENTVTWTWDLLHRTSASDSFASVATSGPQTVPIYHFDKIPIAGQFQVRLVAENSIRLIDTMWWPHLLVRTAPPNSPHAEFTYVNEIQNDINQIVVDGTRSQNTVEWEWTLSYREHFSSVPLAIIAESGPQDTGHYVFDKTNEQLPLPEQGVFVIQLTTRNDPDITGVTDTKSATLFRN